MTLFLGPAIGGRFTVIRLHGQPSSVPVLQVNLVHLIATGDASVPAEKRCHRWYLHKQAESNRVQFPSSAAIGCTRNLLAKKDSIRLPLRASRSPFDLTFGNELRQSRTTFTGNVLVHVFDGAPGRPQGEPSGLVFLADGDH